MKNVYFSCKKLGSTLVSKHFSYSRKKPGPSDIFMDFQRNEEREAITRDLIEWR